MGQQDRALLRPKYYANANCETATGFMPRALRQIANSLGVTVNRHGRRWWVDADEFDAAVQRDAERKRLASVSTEPIDDAERIQRELGLTWKVGA